MGEVREGDRPSDGRTVAAEPVNVSPVGTTQSVRFCRTQDNVNIAVASVGTGPTLVRTPFLVTHIQYDWQHPFMAPLLERLVESRQVVSYDGRGTGLSDRNVAEVTPATFLRDLEAVIGSLNVERVALLGLSGGVAAAVEYTARHPKRVSSLVLYGGYAQGRNKRNSPQYADEALAFYTMLRSGWGCQSAPNFDPVSASNFDPLERRVLTVALAPSELVGVAKTA